MSSLQSHFMPINAAQSGSDSGLHMNGVKRKRTREKTLLNTSHLQSPECSAGDISPWDSQHHGSSRHHFSGKNHKGHHGSRAPIAAEDKVCIFLCVCLFSCIFLYGDFPPSMLSYIKSSPSIYLLLNTSHLSPNKYNSVIFSDLFNIGNFLILHHSIFMIILTPLGSYFCSTRVWWSPLQMTCAPSACGV